MKPIKNRITVRREKTDDKTSGGIILTGEVESKDYGEVVATGPDMKLGLKVGDKVLFGQRIGMEIESNGEKLLVMNDDDVLGVIS